MEPGYRGRDAGESPSRRGSLQFQSVRTQQRTGRHEGGEDEHAPGVDGSQPVAPSGRPTSGARRGSGVFTPGRGSAHGPGASASEGGSRGADKGARSSESSSHRSSRSRPSQLWLRYAAGNCAGCRPNGVPKTNQDSYCISIRVGGHRTVHLFGVFDGHGKNGHLVSGLVKERLPTLMTQELTKLLPDSLLFKSQRRLSSSNREELPRMAMLMKNVVSALETEVFSHPDIDADMSGTTAVIVLLLGRHMFVANVGDSRCVMGSYPDNSESPTDPECQVLHARSIEHVPPASGSVVGSDSSVGPSPQQDAEVGTRESRSIAGMDEEDEDAFSIAGRSTGAGSTGGASAGGRSRSSAPPGAPRPAPGVDVATDVEGAGTGDEDELTPGGAAVLRDGVVESLDVFRAAISRRAAARIQLVAHALTKDHKPDVPAERDRIASYGGYVQPLFNVAVNAFIGPARVWSTKHRGRVPGLAMSRSVGDRVATEVGVISDPVVTYHYLRRAVDQYLVLGSDGVWEFMSNSEVLDVVKRFREPTEAAVALCSVAQRRWREHMAQYSSLMVDDITAIVLQLWPRPNTPRGASSSGGAATTTATSSSMHSSEVRTSSRRLEAAKHQ